MSYYDYTFFLFPYIFYVSFFIVMCLMIYNVYLLCELYLLSIKIFIFVSFKIHKFKKEKKENVVFIYTMEYYPAVKKKEVLPSQKYG